MSTAQVPGTAENEYRSLVGKLKRSHHCRASFSLIPNNLTFNGDLFAYIHCNEVHILSKSTSPTVIKGKVNLDGNSNVTVARWILLKSGYFLVIVTEAGMVYVYDSSAECLIHSHKLDENHLTGQVPVLAVESDSVSLLFIGIQTGAVLTFQVDQQVFVQTKSICEHPSPHIDPISSLAIGTKSTMIACGDSKGAISLCREDNTAGYNLIFGGAGFSCTSLKILNRFVVAAFECGRIRLFDWVAQQLVVELAAHSRSITAIDVSTSENMIACASEDTHITVYQLRDNGKEIEMEQKMCESAPTALWTGVQFTDESSEIAVAAYDSKHLLTLSVDS